MAKIIQILKERWVLQWIRDRKEHSHRLASDAGFPPSRTSCAGQLHRRRERTAPSTTLGRPHMTTLSRTKIRKPCLVASQKWWRSTSMMMSPWNSFRPTDWSRKREVGHHLAHHNPVLTICRRTHRERLVAGTARKWFRQWHQRRITRE